MLIDYLVGIYMNGQRTDNNYTYIAINNYVYNVLYYVIYPKKNVFLNFFCNLVNFLYL